MASHDTSELIALARRLDEAAFSKRTTGLFLIVRGEGERSPESQIRTTARVLREGSTPPPDEPSFTLVPIVPRGNGPFVDMVSVGRAEANDIVLNHTTVSKLHAYFSEPEPGRWALTDHDSMNGTFVGGVRLKPLEPRFLGPSEMVAFGHCHVALKNAAALWRFLSLERRAT